MEVIERVNKYLEENYVLDGIILDLASVKVKGDRVVYGFIVDNSYQLEVGVEFSRIGESINVITGKRVLQRRTYPFMIEKFIKLNGKFTIRETISKADDMADINHDFCMLRSVVHEDPNAIDIVESRDKITYFDEELHAKVEFVIKEGK